MTGSADTPRGARANAALRLADVEVLTVKAEDKFLAMSTDRDTVTPRRNQPVVPERRAAFLRHTGRMLSA